MQKQVQETYTGVSKWYMNTNAYLDMCICAQKFKNAMHAAIYILALHRHELKRSHACVHSKRTPYSRTNKYVNTWIASSQNIPYSCAHTYAHTCIVWHKAYALFMHSHAYIHVSSCRSSSASISLVHASAYKHTSIHALMHTPTHLHASSRSNDCDHTPCSCAKTKETKNCK
jgi:hypothetical protein